jgi:hypothetical protein
MKVVINTCFGGFGLSDAAEDLYAEKSGFNIYRYTQEKYKPHGDGDLYVKVKSGGKHFLSYTFKEDHGDSFVDFPKDGGYWYSNDISRDDPLLVEVVEEMGSDANGSHAELRVVEIPDGVNYDISEYDGAEHIAETHRTWS